MITKQNFGTMPDGRPVHRYRLTGAPGSYVDILDYGATISALVVPDRQGQMQDVVLGYDTLEGYLQGQLYFGATVGRHANRIGGGTFTLDGVIYHLCQNCGPNHSHGGPEGFDRKLFSGHIAGDALTLSLLSPHGDQGYPGAFTLEVTFSFSQHNDLTIHYHGTTDRATVVNLTNHSYFDLSAGANPLGQELCLRAQQFTENDENTLPTGRILPVAGSAFDFRTPKALGRDIDSGEEQLRRCNGYDHNYILDGPGDFARLYSPETGISMVAATDMPGVQLYSGNFIEEPLGKRPYGPRDGVCLETQFFPNALEIPAFPQPILRPGAVYDHVTRYSFQ